MTSRKPPTNDPYNQDINARKVTPDEAEYRDGYVQGQASEQRYQYERERVSESNGAAGGLLLGTLLAALVGGAIALFYYTSQDREPTIVPVTPVPAAPSPTPEAAQPQQPAPRQTTIIERTIERTQQAAPPAPQVNIEVPAPSAPAAQPPQAAPQAAPQAPAAQSEAQTAPPDAAPAQPPTGEAE